MLFLTIFPNLCNGKSKKRLKALSCTARTRGIDVKIFDHFYGPEKCFRTIYNEEKPILSQKPIRGSPIPKTYFTLCLLECIN